MARVSVRGLVSATVRVRTWVMVSLKFRVMAVIRIFVSVRPRAMNMVRIRIRGIVMV
jgi:hypothetical protein